MAFPSSRFRNGPKNSLSRRGLGEAPAPPCRVRWGGSREQEAAETPSLQLRAPGGFLCPRSRRLAAGGRSARAVQSLNCRAGWGLKAEEASQAGAAARIPGTASVRGGGASREAGPGRRGGAALSRPLPTAWVRGPPGRPGHVGKTMPGIWPEREQRAVKRREPWSPVGSTAAPPTPSGVRRGSASGRAAPCARRLPHPRCLAHSGPRYSGAGEGIAEPAGLGFPGRRTASDFHFWKSKMIGGGVELLLCVL